MPADKKKNGLPDKSKGFMVFGRELATDVDPKERVVHYNLPNGEKRRVPGVVH